MKEKQALKKIVKYIKQDCEYYTDKALEDNFCFESPDDNLRYDTSYILALARQGLGEKVKWFKKTL